MSRLVIGLTGGIASGKSAAGEAFSAAGIPILDADQVARDVVQPGRPALDEIRQHFGDEVIDPSGQLDRRRMRELVFANPAERKRLESITHPRISEALAAWRDQQTCDLIVLMVPILVESGMNSLVDRVLLIDAPTALQMQRLIQRDDITETLARQMIDAQMSSDERRQHADDIIDNDSDRSALDAAVRDLVSRYQRAGDTAASLSPILLKASDYVTSN